MANLPEIRETPYNRHIPAVKDEDSRWMRLYKGTKHMWDRRPDMLEFHLYTVPVALAIGALAVGVADETLSLHLAHEMAQVQVEPHSNFVYQALEKGVHEIGKNAQGYEK